MDRGAWWATVTGVTKELDMTEHICMHIDFTQSLILHMEQIMICSEDVLQS